MTISPPLPNSLGSALEWAIAEEAVRMFTPAEKPKYRNHADEIEAVRKEFGR